MIKSVWKFINIIAISHKRGMEQAEIIDTFWTYHQCGRNVRLIEFLRELSLGEYLPFRKTGTHSFPPAPGGAGEVVGGIQDLLVVANSGYIEIVLHGAEPILSIQRLLRLCKHGRVGVLEISEPRPGLSFP